MFFQNTHLKHTVFWVLILSLFLQSFPSPVYALNIKNLLKEIFAGFAPPDELKIDRKGDIYLGKWKLKSCIAKVDIDGDGDKECANPFSGIKLGDDKVSLVNDKGRPDIPRPEILDICELRIPPAEEEQWLTKEERKALMYACSYLRRIQRAASNQVYFAKKLFNSTDPLSDCFFLRNCKNQCYFRFGSVTYNISIFDVGRVAFGPVGWISFAQKIYNIYSQFREIYRVFNQFKQTVASAVSFLNELFETSANFFTFYASLRNMIEVISEGEFGAVLKHYSDNLEKFAQAKSETQILIADMQKESNALAGELKNEDWAEFLYQENSADREKLNAIVENYLLNFETVEQVIDKLIANGNFLAHNIKELGGQGWMTCPDDQLVSGVYVDQEGIISKIRCSYFYGRTNNQRILKAIDISGEKWYFCEDGLYAAELRKNDNGKIDQITCAEIIESSGDGEWITQPSPTISWNSGLNECPDGKYIAAVYRGNNHTENIKCRDADGPAYKLTCNENPSSACYTTKNTLPNNCYPTIFSDKVLIICPEINYSILSEEQDLTSGGTSKTYNFNNINQSQNSCVFNCQDKGEYSATQVSKYCSGFPDNCYVECNPYNELSFYCQPPTKEECQISWEWNEGNLSCPKKECDISYTPNFGTHTLSCPEITGEVELTCPSNCSYSCASPANQWFESFKDMHQKLVDVKENISAYKIGLNLFNLNLAQAFLQDARDYQNIFFRGVDDLNPNLNYPDKGNQFYYWSTTTSDISAQNPADAINQAEAICGYNSSFAYLDWDNKTKTIRNVYLPTIIKYFKQYIDEYIDGAPTNRKLNFLEAFLATPVISFQMDEIKEKAPAGTAAVNRLNELFFEINKIWFSNENKEVSNSEFIKKIIETSTFSGGHPDGLGNPPQGIKQKLDELIPLIESSLTAEQRDFLLNFQANVGEYACPDKNNPAGFLGELRCFEERKRNLHQLYVLAKSVENLEAAAAKLNEVKKKVAEIKPTLEIPEIEIKANIDLDESGGIKMDAGMSFEGKNIDNTAGFLDKIDETTYSVINEMFGAAGQKIGEVKNFLNWIGGKIVLFDNSGNPLYDFLDKNKDEFDKINIKKHSLLINMVLGNQELRNACRDLNLILKQDPEYFKSNCPKTYSDYQDALGKTSEELCKKRDNIINTTGYFDKNLSDFCLMENYRDFWKNNFCSFSYKHCQGDGYYDCVKSAIGEEKYKKCTTEYYYTAWPDCFDEAIRQLKNECSKFINNLKQDEFEKICSPETESDCDQLRDTASLKQGCDDYFNLETNFSDTNFSDKLTDAFKFQIPDLTKPENKDKLNQVRNICSTQLSDIRTPLEEIMDVYSFLLGWSSGTHFFRGIQTSKQSAIKAYQNAQKLLAMIKGVPEKMKAASRKKADKSGLSIDALQCIAMPAKGWRDQTGPEGGPVCPRIDYLFSIIESNFGIVRQNLHQIDMLRRKPEWVGIDVWGLSISLWEKYNVREFTQLNPLIRNPVDDIIYDEAEEIRDRARNLWATATALNFANQNCTCGMSYCKFPVCISGIPLTFSPLKDPYCYLVYILRHPMLKQAKVLENYLK